MREQIIPINWILDPMEADEYKLDFWNWRRAEGILEQWPQFAESMIAGLL